METWCSFVICTPKVNESTKTSTQPPTMIHEWKIERDETHRLQSVGISGINCWPPSKKSKDLGSGRLSFAGIGGDGTGSTDG